MSPPRRPDSRARRGLAARCFRRAPAVTLAAVFLGGVVCSAPMAAADLPGTTAGDGGRANAVAAVGILPRIDTLLDGLETRIEDIRAQAEQMLDHADAATDSEDQMRFEEMYGKLVAAAEELEEERGRLRSMRDELAAAGQRQ